MSAPQWEVRRDPRDPNAWDVYAGPEKIAHLPWQQEARAKLIASAPEMANLLLAIYQHICGGGPKRGDVEDVLRRAGLIQ